MQDFPTKTLADMRHFRTFLTIVALCLTALTAQGQREVYDRYAAREGLTVAYVADLQVDSGVVMDVVLIHVDDTAVWRQLKEEFHVTGHSDTAGRPEVVVAMRDRQDPTRWPGRDVMGNCLLKITPPLTEICLFFYKDPGQVKPLFKMLIRKVRESTQKPPVPPSATLRDTATEVTPQ